MEESSAAAAAVVETNNATEQSSVPSMAVEASKEVATSADQPPPAAIASKQPADKKAPPTPSAGGATGKENNKAPSSASNNIEFEPPAACIRRLLKQALPQSTNVSKDSLAAISRASGIFVLYLTACANDVAREGRRTTIVAKDVLGALKELDFEEFVPLMEQFLEGHRKEESKKKEEKERIKKAKEDNTNTTEGDSQVRDGNTGKFAAGATKDGAGDAAVAENFHHRLSPCGDKKTLGDGENKKDGTTNEEVAAAAAKTNNDDTTMAEPDKSESKSEPSTSAVSEAAQEAAGDNKHARDEGEAEKNEGEPSPKKPKEGEE